MHDVTSKVVAMAVSTVITIWMNFPQMLLLFSLFFMMVQGFRLMFPFHFSFVRTKEKRKQKEKSPAALFGSRGRVMLAHVGYQVFEFHGTVLHRLGMPFRFFVLVACVLTVMSLYFKIPVAIVRSV